MADQQRTGTGGEGVDRERHEALRTVGRFMSHIGLCSCGAPQAFLRQLLAGLDAYLPLGERVLAPRVVFDPRNDRADMMTAHLLDMWELTDHGTALPGGWLLADGIRLRDALRRLDLSDATSDLAALLPSGSWWRDEQLLNPQCGTAGLQLGPWRHDS